jgi:anti-sigma B factor antagonist
LNTPSDKGVTVSDESLGDKDPQGGHRTAQDRRLRVFTRKVGRVVAARVSAEHLTAANVKDFKAKMAVIAEPKAKIVLDVGELQFVDSAGIGALLSLVKNLSASEGEIRLCNVTKQVRGLLELVRVDRFLKIYDSREEAIASFGRS